MSEDGWVSFAFDGKSFDVLRGPKIWHVRTSGREAENRALELALKDVLHLRENRLGTCAVRVYTDNRFTL